MHPGAAVAKERSDLFDQAFFLSCDAAKSRVATQMTRCDEGKLLASEFGYACNTALDLLGLHIPLTPGCIPTLLKFRTALAKRRLRLIGVASSHLRFKQFLVRSLVLPLLTWAGGFARATHAELRILCQDVRALLGQRLARDSPAVILHEVLGWKCHPKFAMHRASLLEAVRLCTLEDLSWISEPPPSSWISLLPVTLETLNELGWWHEDAGRRFCRRDLTGMIRRYYVGIDSFAVLEEWLRDWHRRRALSQCQPVHRSQHRPDDPTLAQGLRLPGIAPHTLCTFQGHVEAWRLAQDAIDRSSALAAGCSAWHKHCRAREFLSELPLCLCGRKLPSRPHLVWVCPCTDDLWAALRLPVDRLEERLFAVAMPEIPAPPAVLDQQAPLAQMGADFDRQLTRQGHAFVATDGSVVDTVAAWAAVIEGAGSYAAGIDAEDQTNPLPSPLLALQCKRLQHALDPRVRIRLWWVPPHNKLAPGDWTCPPCGEDRALNALADEAARVTATQCAQNSGRQLCARARADALARERQVLSCLRRIARRWALA